MKLFAELYLDEDVSVLIATLLRVRGFNVTTAREAFWNHHRFTAQCLRTHASNCCPIKCAGCR